MEIKRTELDAIIGMLDEVIDDCVPYTRKEGIIGDSYRAKQNAARNALKLIENIFYGSFGNKYVITEVIADDDEENEEE